MWWGPHYCGTRGAAHLQGVCGGDQAGQKGGGPFNEDPTASIFYIGNDELVLLLSTLCCFALLLYRMLNQ